MKKSKIFSIIMVAFMLIAILSNITFAFDPADITGDTSNPAATKVLTVGQRILGIVKTVGIIVAVVTLSLLGIKYMMGSVEEKAEYKKTLLPYLIGAIFVLAATQIAGWIYDASQGFFN